MRNSLPIVITLAALLVGCTEGQIAQTHENRAMLVSAWNACIASGGIPIPNTWLGAPAMERCQIGEPK